MNLIRGGLRSSGGIVLSDLDDVWQVVRREPAGALLILANAAGLVLVVLLLIGP